MIIYSMSYQKFMALFRRESARYMRDYYNGFHKGKLGVTFRVWKYVAEKLSTD
jgi:hypothetical protein